jgi:hypothetical protein
MRTRRDVRRDEELLYDSCCIVNSCMYMTKTFLGIPLFVLVRMRGNLIQVLLIKKIQVEAKPKLAKGYSISVVT